MKAAGDFEDLLEKWKDKEVPIQDIPVVSGDAARFGAAGIAGIRQHRHGRAERTQEIAANGKESLKQLNSSLNGIAQCAGKLDPDHKKQFDEIKKKINNYPATYGAFFRAISP